MQHVGMPWSGISIRQPAVIRCVPFFCTDPASLTFPCQKAYITLGTLNLQLTHIKVKLKTMNSAKTKVGKILKTRFSWGHR